MPLVSPLVFASAPSSLARRPAVRAQEFFRNGHSLGVAFTGLGGVAVKPAATLCFNKDALTLLRFTLPLPTEAVMH
jgi:hypothetical protein